MATRVRGWGAAAACPGLRGPGTGGRRGSGPPRGRQDVGPRGGGGGGGGRGGTGAPGGGGGVRRVADRGTMCRREGGHGFGRGIWALQRNRRVTAVRSSSFGGRRAFVEAGDGTGPRAAGRPSTAFCWAV